MGGLSVLALIVLAAFLLLRRRRRKSSAAVSLASEGNNEHVRNMVEPFPVTATSESGASLCVHMACSYGESGADFRQAAAMLVLSARLRLLGRRMSSRRSTAESNGVLRHLKAPLHQQWCPRLQDGLRLDQRIRQYGPCQYLLRPRRRGCRRRKDTTWVWRRPTGRDFTSCRDALSV